MLPNLGYAAISPSAKCPFFMSYFDKGSVVWRIIFPLTDPMSGALTLAGVDLHKDFSAVYHQTISDIIRYCTERS